MLLSFLSPALPQPSHPSGTNVNLLQPPAGIHYLSWVHNPSTLNSDVNKLVRLAKRLPDKANIFYRELHRVRSAALAYGCPELLQKIHQLILVQFEHQATAAASCTTRPPTQTSNPTGVLGARISTASLTPASRTGARAVEPHLDNLRQLMLNTRFNES
ncbi:unnamed protein product [Protopolystoma xenopodis]|uniref:Integrator complex subunit 14 C-terminal domain-containing protein n=1 Tax=Protopolystoma xenopodis TaxID=117903 RepID=A0A3S5B180_9PLAT|nr:unnamed protein product [Protopolystoma xenopodis]